MPQSHFPHLPGQSNFFNLERYSSKIADLIAEYAPSKGATLAALGGGGALWATATAIRGLGTVHAQVAAHRWFWEKQLMGALRRLNELGLLPHPAPYQAVFELLDTESVDQPPYGAWYSSIGLFSPGYDRPLSPELEPAPVANPQAAPLIYVALGDSAAQGVGVQDPRDCYVARFASFLQRATGREVILLNLSVSGAVASSVVATQLPALAQLGISPDIVTLDIGGNDTFYPVEISVEDFAAALDTICRHLPAPALISDVPACRPFANQQRSTELNEVLVAAARAYGHTVVPVRDYSEDPRFWRLFGTRAGDGFHPNREGYLAAARLFAYQSVDYLREKGWWSGGVINLPPNLEAAFATPRSVLSLTDPAPTTPAHAAYLPPAKPESSDSPQ